MRGEKGRKWRGFHLNEGSPPRARGKDGIDFDAMAEARITPACAGKSTFLQPGIAASWDHPRVRGEKQYCAPQKEPPRGSPPRARGKVGSPSKLMAKEGITPACAGKSPFSELRFLNSGDHPRVRGEKMVWR